MKTSITRLALLLLLTASSVIAQAAPVDMQKRAQELKNLKWGMFICWSLSTFSEKEWTPGITDISFFRATSVDTEQWARTAKQAGMGYILFLTKHHDGFCLWDTQTTDRKVTNAPLGRDVLAELRKSCHKHGIRLALYFSEGEWRHPGGLDHPATPEPKKENQGGRDPAMKKAQLKELLTQYGPIEYIWFDHAVGDGGLSHAETLGFCKALQPGCFIGFNHGDQAGADIRLGEMGRPGPLDDPSAAGPHMRNAPSKDYLLAEFTYPIQPRQPKGATWFYSHPDNEGVCHSAEKLHRDYLGAVKFGNIFSSNVGPDYNGKLRDIDVKTLREVGALIRGEATLPVPIPGGKASASSTWPQAGYEADKADDNDSRTRWGAAADSRSGWLAIDFDGEPTVRAAKVDEMGFARVRKYEIQARMQDGWKTITTGTSIDSHKELGFPAPVSATAFRLNLLEASDVPTIGEFQLLE